MLLIGVALGCIVNLPAMLSWAYRRWEVGEQFDQCMFQESRFALRITTFHQRGAFLGAPGGFYRYEVKTSTDWCWRTMVTFRRPVAESIPYGQFQSVTDSCAYFFHGHVFGVTTDGGTSWSIKGGDGPPIFSGQTFPYADIESVAIGRDGAGMMRLSDYNPAQLKPLPSQSLTTSDFGQTWKKSADAATD